MQRRIKLLFVTRDWSQGIERNTFYLGKELEKLTQYMEWHEPGNINDIVAQLPERPDFILLNDIRATRCPEITGLSHLTIPFGTIIHDTTHQQEVRRAFIRNNDIRYLFVHYRESFLKLYPEFADRMIWFPHWVNTSVFTDYKLPKSYDYLFMGCTSDKVYPLRSKILDVMGQEPGFTYHPHPGYDQGAYTEDRFIIGKRYAQEINRAKIFLTDNSIYHHVLMKYFEVPACNTLLLAPHWGDTADLGFVPSVNFVAVTDGDFLSNARYYLENYENAGQHIARRGYELVRSRHSVEVRARQLVGHITKILGRA